MAILDNHRGTMDLIKSKLPVCSCGSPIDVLLRLKVKKEDFHKTSIRPNILGFCNNCYDKCKDSYQQSEDQLHPTDRGHGYYIKYMREVIIEALKPYLTEFIRQGHDKNKLMELWDEAVVRLVHKE